MALNYISIAIIIVGSVCIKNTRYSVGCVLLADLAGFAMAIFAGYLFLT
jgi:spore maturation protein SpmB